MTKTDFTFVGVGIIIGFVLGIIISIGPYNICRDDLTNLSEALNESEFKFQTALNSIDFLLEEMSDCGLLDLEEEHNTPPSIWINDECVAGGCCVGGGCMPPSDYNITSAQLPDSSWDIKYDNFPSGGMVQK